MTMQKMQNFIFLLISAVKMFGHIYMYIFLSIHSWFLSFLPFFCTLKPLFSTSRKPCSGYKMKEITGSGIFLDSGETDPSESGNITPNNRTGIRMYQVLLFSVFLFLA